MTGEGGGDNTFGESQPLKLTGQVHSSKKIQISIKHAAAGSNTHIVVISPFQISDYLRFSFINVCLSNMWRSKKEHYLSLSDDFLCNNIYNMQKNY